VRFGGLERVFGIDRGNEAWVNSRSRRFSGSYSAVSALAAMGFVRRQQLLEALESGKWWATENSVGVRSVGAIVGSRHCVAVTSSTRSK
jgi:hypothetical protein